MKLKQQLIGSDRYKYKAPYSMSPLGIAIHNTENSATAKNEIAYMVRNNNYTSYHIAVDDIEAIQAIPFNRNAFHAGDGSNGTGNRRYIGLEICYSKSGGSKFDKAEQNAAKVTADILKQYGWGIDKVKRHKDFSGKNCPRLTMQKGWQRFLNMVSKELGTSTGVTTGGGTVPNNAKNYISQGDTGNAVLNMQNDLAILGFELDVTGTFENTTKSDVLKFQKLHNLKQDGIVGVNSMAKIKEQMNDGRVPKVFRRTIRGIAVKTIQENLKEIGYSVNVNSLFDTSTTRAVERFQVDKGMLRDGIVDWRVRDAINKALHEKRNPKPEPKKELYRVRLTWGDTKSQKNAYTILQSAIDEANKYEGYSVYDEKGVAVYTNKVIIKPKPEINPAPQPVVPTKPTNNDIAITGKSVATAKQMEKALNSKNKNPKIKISTLEFCQLFLEEGEAEGIRGDIAFCQAMKETGWLSYGGQVLPEQNNYAGIGATNNSAIGKGNWFDNERIGIRAQIQHLKAYANKEPLVNENVDQRFRFVTRGIAPNWINLNGRWAVPGTTYGQDIIKMYIELIEIVIENDKIEPEKDKTDEYIAEINRLKAELIKAYATIDAIKNLVK